MSYPVCLLISVAIGFGCSLFGFQKLSVFISYVMSMLYPVLLVTTSAAFIKERLAKRVVRLGEKEVNHVA